MRCRTPQGTKGNRATTIATGASVVALIVWQLACQESTTVDPPPPTVDIDAADVSAPGPQDSMPDIRIIAHRGASAYAPENTLPAFEIAQELGVRDVELDVHLTQDGQLVLFHDSNLDKKTDLRGPPSTYTLAQLEAADIGSWFDRTHPESTRKYAGTGLLGLDALFGRFGRRFHYHIEIKGDAPNLPRLLLSLIDARFLRNRVTISSFSKPQLERMRALDSRLRITWLLDREARLLGPGEDPLAMRKRQLREASGAGFDAVALRAAEFRPELVSEAKARGLGLRAWGVRNLDEVERVALAGADGMTVDWPDRARERLRSREKESKATVDR